jgi:hypothetical protein
MIKQDLLSLEGLNPNAKEFKPTYPPMPELILVKQDLFTQFSIKPGSETPNEPTNRHMVCIDGLINQKPITPEDKNGRYTWGINMAFNEEQIQYYIREVDNINMSPLPMKDISSWRHEYNYVLNKMKNNIYCRIPLKAILYSYYIQYKEGYFKFWDMGMFLEKRNLFILGIYEIVG